MNIFIEVTEKGRTFWHGEPVTLRLGRRGRELWRLEGADRTSLTFRLWQLAPGDLYWLPATATYTIPRALFWRSRPIDQVRSSGWSGDGAGR